MVGHGGELLLLRGKEASMGSWVGISFLMSPVTLTDG